jgi:GNAT superfamily N-acetyltransferase
MIVKVEKAYIKDIGHLVALEVKSQEYPISQESVKNYIEDADKRAYVAFISNRKVGMALTLSNDAERTTTIVRVSVHPDFRCMGVGKALMHEVEKEAWKASHHVLRLHVPSYKVEDRLDPDCIVEWLEKNYFKASGCITDSYFRYGKWWDGYIFERLI